MTVKQRGNVMSNQPMLFSVYRDEDKIKSIRLIGSGGNLTQKEIRNYITNPTQDFYFFDSKTKAIETEERLIGVLHSVEKCDDVKLLTRIIKNGGFVEYIKKLEGENDASI